MGWGEDGGSCQSLFSLSNKKNNNNKKNNRWALTSERIGWHAYHFQNCHMIYPCHCHCYSLCLHVSPTRPLFFVCFTHEAETVEWHDIQPWQVLLNFLGRRKWIWGETKWKIGNVFGPVWQADGLPWSLIPYHTLPWTLIPHHTIPYTTIEPAWWTELLRSVCVHTLYCLVCSLFTILLRTRVCPRLG